MGYKRRVSLLLAFLILLTSLVGCASGDIDDSDTSSTPPASLENDGSEVSIVIAELDNGEAHAEALELIIEKYRADFPNTSIEVKLYDDQDAIKAALESGEADIAELTNEEVLPYRDEGLLLDMYSYMTAWTEWDSLTEEAAHAATSLGAYKTYLLPWDFNQELMFYRSDWFDEYNSTRDTSEWALWRSWDQIFLANERLGEKGLVTFAGKDKLVDSFDSMLWGTVGKSRIIDYSAAYFSAVVDHTTIFSLELAAEGVTRFKRAMNITVPGTLDFTEEDAVQAFIDGEAAMLIANSKVAERLKAEMPEGTWDTEGCPRGIMGSAIVGDSFVGWGVSAKAENPEATVHFLTYLCNADNNTYFAKQCGTLPIHREGLDMEESLLETERSREMEMILDGEWFLYGTEPIMYKAIDGYRELADEKIRAFLDGSLSSEELLKFFEDYWTEAYEKEGKLW